MRIFLGTVLMWGVAGLPRMGVAQETNACGCYRAPNGVCVCTSKKKKCECPGECEPLGCEAQRQKMADKEAEAALKRINAKEKKKAAEAKADSKQTKKNAAKRH
jgi:hypothetical protein